MTRNTQLTKRQNKSIRVALECLGHLGLLLVGKVAEACSPLICLRSLAAGLWRESIDPSLGQSNRPGQVVWRPNYAHYQRRKGRTTFMTRIQKHILTESSAKHALGPSFRALTLGMGSGSAKGSCQLKAGDSWLTGPTELTKTT